MLAGSCITPLRSVYVNFRGISNSGVTPSVLLNGFIGPQKCTC